VLGEVLKRYYGPRNGAAMERLRRVFELAEESYFAQWSAQRFESAWHAPTPGEFMFDHRLVGTMPGPAAHLREPFLDAEGRAAYRDGLVAILKELPRLDGQCDDGGRLDKIRRGVIVTLNLLNTICSCLGETIP